MDAASQRSAPNSMPEFLPTSQYLQDRLQERRTRITRPRHARRSDFASSTKTRDDDIFFSEAQASRRNNRRFDSSPLTALARAESDAGATGSHPRRRPPGVRDVDEQLDRLNKENFALKLELDHRRDHTVKLQQQINEMQAHVDRAERLEEEHAELLRINSQLVEELEKRDKAVEEAMDIICDLEDKVADFDERSTHTRPSTANADSGYAGTETHETVPRSSPPQLKTPHAHARQPPPTASAAASKLFNAVNAETPAKIRREPSVLSQKKPSTHALRSVYLEASGNLHPVKSFNSLLSKRDNSTDEAAADLDSPRLSALSESSFPSIYSPQDKNKTSPEKYPWEEPETEEHFRQDSINRINRWIDEGSAGNDTPSKSNRLSMPISESTIRPTPPPPPPPPPMLRSIEDDSSKLLHSSPATTAIPAAAQLGPDMLQHVSHVKSPRRAHGVPPRSRRPRPTSMAGPIFGESILPPTPEDSSIRMLRTSQSSMAEERSILDTTPAPVRGYNALEPGIRTAPRQMRSSVELKSAYHSNLMHRDSALDDEDDEERSETIKELHTGYRGYPDGESILTGTPSRFIRYGKPPASMLFDGSDLSPPGADRLAMTRRKSSSETASSPWRPSLGRADTSPPLPGRANVNFSRLTVDTSVTSPKSSHSGSSGNRTIIQNPIPEDRSAVLSPEPPQTRSHISAASPTRSITHRTQKFFRRLSGGQQDQQTPILDPRSYREKPPLPRLTSTPSSAYVTTIPKEIRRPGTADTGKHSGPSSFGSNIQRAPSRSRERPSTRSRSTTGTKEVRSASITAIDAEDEKEKKSLFRRSLGLKPMTPGPETPPVPAPTPTTAPAETETKYQKRKNSIRGAVAGIPRRPWGISGQ